MEKKQSKFDELVQKFDCQLIKDEEQLLLLAGTGNGISLYGSNNCSCQGNNCQCANNCTCDGNNCQCGDSNPKPENSSDFICWIE